MRRWRQPFAQREATAALSHGFDSLVQSHCYFPFAFSPSSTRRRFFKTLFRWPMASTVRFNLLAITILSILDSSNARS
jgi:hypothetical protein